MRGVWLRRAAFSSASLVLLAAGAALWALGGVAGVRECSFLSRRFSTVVVDAGHGGADGGAVSPSGLKESEINLDIARRLELVLAFFGVRVVMTRESEDIQYSPQADTIREKKVEDQQRRLKLIGAVENAVLISVHQNIFPDSRPFGAQVLYAPTPHSRELAEYMQQVLVGALNAKNRRTAVRVPESIMIMNHVKCPAVLVECGFLSNPEEERLLGTDSYRLKVAAAVAAGYLGAERGGENGGTDEG